MPTYRSFGVLLLLLAALPLFAAGRKSYPMNVPAEGAKTIAFDVQEGDFVLRGDPNVHEVKMNVSIDRTWIFKLGEEGILKRLIKVSGEGTDTVTIRTDIPRAITNWGRAEYPIDFVIIVPAKARIELKDTSGKIEISNLEGPVDVDDGSGTFSARQLAAGLRLRKETGDIKLDSIRGETVVNSHSGQMHGSRLDQLTIEQSNGNLDLADIGPARINNDDGNVTILRASGDVDLTDTSGEIRVSDVRGTVHLRDTSGEIRTSHTGALTISDTSGNVRVDTAPELRVTNKESGEVVARNVTGQIEVPPEINLKRQ